MISTASEDSQWPYRLESSCDPFQDLHLPFLSSPLANKLPHTL